MSRQKASSTAPGATSAAASPALPRTALSRGPCGLVQEVAARYLEEYDEKIRLVVSRLSEDQVWWRPGEGDEAADRVNSIGNLLLHLCGNLSLWVLAGIGGEGYERHRSAEFAARHTHGRDRLLEDLSTVVQRAAAVLRRLDEEDLERYLSIQGYTTNVLGAAFHAVEHMSYHTGQILVLAKQQLAASEEIELYPQHRGE